MATEFFYVRSKTTGQVSRVVAKPYLGQNSDMELLTEEEVAELRRPKVKPTLNPFSSDVDDLLSESADGEDGL